MLATVVAILLFEHCAKIPGSISGGVKDTIPPRFLHSIPPNYSTGFDVNTKRVDLVFDEFLQLKDVSNQFYSSPPIHKKPELLSYGKYFRINLKEPLLPNITYSFNFGDAIVDNNEGNILKGFLYVVSTGDHIDSLTFTGQVLNAFDLKPRKKDDKVPTVVLLFDDLSDSAVYKSTPTYMSRVDELGFFTIPHIRPDTFLIFAIRDMGNNLLFDMPTEQIAFSDTLIVIDQRYYRAPDTTSYRSFNVPDSIKKKRQNMIHKDIVLYQFQEDPTKQYRIAYERTEPNLLRLVYSLPVDSLPIHIADYEPTGKWFELEMSGKKDTLDFWLLDTTLVNRPTLMVEVLSPRTDSLNRLIHVHDTLKMSYTFPKQQQSSGRNARRNKEVKVEKPRTVVDMMSIKSNVANNGIMDLTNRLQLTASQPIEDIDRSKIILQELVDTIKKVIPYTLVPDSGNMRRVYIDWTLKEDTKYSLSVDTMSFTSIYHVFSDSTGINFASQKKDYYSSIEVTFSNVTCPLVVQVLKGEQENVIKQVQVPEDATIALIDYLKPDKYQLKVIYDTNGNGKWDTGNYLKKIQPEKVEYFSEPEVATRSGWKTELQWTLGQQKPDI